MGAVPSPNNRGALPEGKPALVSATLDARAALRDAASAAAEALFVSPNTVKTHVASLLNKLPADSRVQLATIGTKQSLHARIAIGAR